MPESTLALAVGLMEKPGIVMQILDALAEEMDAGTMDRDPAIQDLCTDLAARFANPYLTPFEAINSGCARWGEDVLGNHGLGYPTQGVPWYSSKTGMRRARVLGAAGDGSLRWSLQFSRWIETHSRPLTSRERREGFPPGYTHTVAGHWRNLPMEEISATALAELSLQEGGPRILVSLILAANLWAANPRRRAWAIRLPRGNPNPDVAP